MGITVFDNLDKLVAEQQKAFAAMRNRSDAGDWFAIKGDVFNPDRTYGISRFLSRQEHELVDGSESVRHFYVDPATGAFQPCRTEVVAEVLSATGDQDLYDALLLAAAPQLFVAAFTALEVLTDAQPITEGRLSELMQLLYQALSKAVDTKHALSEVPKPVGTEDMFDANQASTETKADKTADGG